MEQEFYRGLALRVRNLAEGADPFTKERLLKLAETYDVKGGNPAGSPRPMGRPLPIPRATPPASFFSARGEAG